MKQTCWLILVVGFLIPSAVFGAGEEGTDDPSAGFENFFTQQDRSQWNPILTSGFDALLHSYPLATTDTTETITEYNISAGIEGRSSRRVQHRWRLRAAASFGSELFREQLEGQYKYVTKERVTRLRLDGHLNGRQYRKSTSYTLSSDNFDGRLDLRYYPWAWQASTLELRGWGAILDYKTPSTLEVDAQDLGTGVFLRSRGLTENLWSVGYRYSSRVYPDTTGINRNVHRIEGDLDYHDDQGQGVRLFHKSGRRLIKDETMKPSAWAHWTDCNGLVTAGTGFVYLDLESEVWTYDEETSTYFDTWRLGGVLGYRWGDILKATWRLGVTAENLNAGDQPESYSQFGLRSGVESYGDDLSGSLQLEFGRRVYGVQNSSLSEDGLDIDTFYSDFNYFKIWLMANWDISRKFSLDLMASYEPENHTENEDDSSLGFSSLRLVWRP